MLYVNSKSLNFWLATIAIFVFSSCGAVVSGEKSTVDLQFVQMEYGVASTQAGLLHDNYCYAVHITGTGQFAPFPKQGNDDPGEEDVACEQSPSGPGRIFGLYSLAQLQKGEINLEFTSGDSARFDLIAIPKTPGAARGMEAFDPVDGLANCDSKLTLAENITSTKKNVGVQVDGVFKNLAIIALASSLVERPLSAGDNIIGMQWVKDENGDMGANYGECPGLRDEMQYDDRHLFTVPSDGKFPFKGQCLKGYNVSLSYAPAANFVTSTGVVNPTSIMCEDGYFDISVQMMGSMDYGTISFNQSHPLLAGKAAKVWQFGPDEGTSGGTGGGVAFLTLQGSIGASHPNLTVSFKATTSFDEPVVGVPVDLVLHNDSDCTSTMYTNTTPTTDADGIAAFSVTYSSSTHLRATSGTTQSDCFAINP